MLNACIRADVTVADHEAADECRARAGIYRLLGGVFVEEPTAAFLAALRSPVALASLAGAGVIFDADFTETDADSLVDRLSCEFANLFTVSGGFPPVESVRLYGRYQQEPTHQTRETYRRLGFTLGKGRFEVFPDQLGVELLFVAELLDRCATALAAGDEAQFRRLDKEIKRFWVAHLGRWVRGYASLIERAAEHSYYREMAGFLAGFADEEIAAMALKVEDADQGRLVVPKQEVPVEVNPDEPVCDGCAPGRPDGRARVQLLHDLR
jgi:TorA maturation chaperone TorD